MKNKYIPPTVVKRVDKEGITDLSDTSSVLYTILSMMRPAGSKTEKRMIRKYIDPLKPLVDDFGNRIVTIPRKDGKASRTLFSCHTDTVHIAEGIQKIYLDTAVNEIFVDESNCLGADDGTGVYIMLTMIKHNVPGTYIFHRAEEIGCQGSSFIVKSCPKWLCGFDRAIAFDRKGMDEVIIAQAPGLIASDKFGDALAEAINAHNTILKYKTSKYGSITDTAKYHNQIPECVNLSVGYKAQHCSTETQCIEHLRMLVPALIKVKWEELPTERKAGPAAPKYANNNNNQWNGHNSNQINQYPRTNTNNNTNNNTSLVVTPNKLALIIMRHPRVALAMLEELSPTVEDLWAAEYAVENEDLLDKYKNYGQTNYW